MRRVSEILWVWLLLAQLACAGPLVEYGNGNIILPQGQNMVCVAGTTYRGAGRENTEIVSTYVYSTTQQCCFQVAPGVVFEDLHLRCADNASDQSCLIGYGCGVDGKAAPGTQAAPFAGSPVTIRRCILDGGTFQAYIWAGYGPGIKLIIEDCQFINCPRWPICQGNSGGTDAGGIEFYRCRVVGSSVGCTHVGLQGLRQAGVVINGGYVYGEDSDFTLTGDSTLTVQAGAYSLETGLPASNMTLKGCTFTLFPNGAPASADLWEQTCHLIAKGCYGTSADGTLSVKGSPTIIK